MRDTESIDGGIGEIEQAHGPVEVLVANAGMTRDQLLMRMSDEEFEEVLDVNLTGVFRCVRRVSKGMIRKRGGRIILMGSVVGMYGNAGQVNYSATKAALVGMARSITRELGSRNITANVIAPGFIDTDMTRELPEARQEALKAAIPAGRFGDVRSEEHTSELQSRGDLVCRVVLEKKHEGAEFELGARRAHDAVVRRATAADR